MLVALGAVQQGLELLDERLPSLWVGPAEQLLGLAASWLSSTRACGGAGPRGSSRDSTPTQSARASSRPGGARSSAALDRPLLGVGWPPCAGPRRPPRRVRLRAVGKKGTAAARAAVGACDRVSPGKEDDVRAL